MIKCPPRRRIVVLALYLGLGGCSNDSTGPDEDREVRRDDVVQSYVAEVFTATEAGTVVDYLELGSSLSLELHGDGTTTGRLIVPEVTGTEGAIDQSLAGTFTFDDAADEVTFQQTADTFVRDMTFAAVWAEGRLQLEDRESFGSTAVRVVLRPD